MNMLKKLPYITIILVISIIFTIVTLVKQNNTLEKENERLRTENVKLSVEILKYETKEIEKTLSVTGLTDPAIDRYLAAHPELKGSE